MNLVQINERLKDMPLRAVEMYANGSSPQVPAYLALAEMQRREKLSKQAAMEQGAVNKPMPSIKEQIEQRAGLMALQQGRMQQGQQQMADQSTSRPMPVPPNVESAEEQPQAEDSGIARLPVNNDMYRFAKGGIIGFSGEDESYVPLSPEEFERLPTREAKMEALRRYNERVVADNIRAAKQREAQEREQKLRTREEQLRFLDTASPAAAANVRREAGNEFTAEASPTPQPSVSELQRILNTQPSGSVATKTAAKPRPTNVQQPPQADPTQPVQPQASQTNAAKLPSSLPAIFTDPEYMKVVKDSMKQKTPQQLFQEQQELLKMQGITGPLGAEQERRIRERQADYESKKPTGLQDLIRVLGQAGQYKGLSGVAPAYTSLQQQRRAEDLKFREEQDRLLDALEEKRRAEATGRASAIREDIFKGKDVAARTAGQVSAAQLQAQAEFIKQGMSDEAAERLAGIKFEYERRLRSIPQAQRPDLKEQYVAALVKNGLPPDKAIEAAMKLGVGEEGVDVKALKSMQEIAMKTLDPLSGAKPEEKEAARLQLAEINRRLMQISGMGGGKFIVKVGDQTFGFPTQEAADKFKAQAGVK